MFRHRSAIVAAALAALAALPGSAHAATAFGSNLVNDADPPDVPLGCSASATCTGVNESLPQANTLLGGLTSPITGVVVKWRVASDSSGNPVALRILHPAGGTSFTATGTSEPGMTSNAAASAEFQKRLAIQAGDSAGLDAGANALVWAATPGANVLTWSDFSPVSPLSDGSTKPGTERGGFELRVQAVVEPDADRDGFGDESQDGCPGDPKRQTPPCGTGQTNPNGNPPANPGDRTKPVVSGLRVGTLRLGGRTRIRLRVSETARLKLSFARLVAGHRSGRRCVRGAAGGHRCTAAVGAGSVSLRAQGSQSIIFDGRVTGRLLRPGRYRLTVTATDLAGNAGAPRTTTFTVLAHR